MLICGGAFAATSAERDSGDGLTIISDARGGNLMTGSADNLSVTWGHATKVSTPDANVVNLFMTPKVNWCGSKAVVFTSSGKTPIDSDFTLTPDPGGSLINYPNSDYSKGVVSNSPPAVRGVSTATEENTAEATKLVQKIAITTATNKNPARMEAVRVPTVIPVGP